MWTEGWGKLGYGKKVKQTDLDSIKEDVLKVMESLKVEWIFCH